MEIWELFVVALIPVLETLFIAIVGLFLAVDRVNILCAAARHHLNNLVFYVFFPALLASGLVNSSTEISLLSLWFTPVSILLTSIIGSALGWILVKVTSAPRQLHGLVIGCCAAGNLGNLPVIIIPAICDEKNNPFGDSSTCSINGMTYVSLSMSIGAVFVWSFVYNIIRAYGNKDDVGIKINSTISEQKCDKSSEIFSDSSREALLSKSIPCYEVHEAPVELLRGSSEDRNKVTIFKKINVQVNKLVKIVDLTILLRPPTIATIVGLIIGVVTPIHHVLVGDNAPLHVIANSVSLLGEAAIPSMTLIMGANLLRGFKRSRLSIWLIIGITIVRFIILPLFGILVIKAAQSFGMVGSDPLYHFVLLLQYAVPPALAIGTITQLFEVGETECSVIMFWNYIVASIAVTLWSTYYMWILS
ncbi:Auxin efflux carrier family protein [Forsythia ovata]|uniref:Auxin efflux carrier family protein n=1 Tax=Forsythia ovata TaxID=205694 RepID=A0ABD1UAU0_9LAMI